MKDTTTPYYRKLEEKFAQIQQLFNIGQTIYWDMEINLPGGAASYRHQELATFHSLLHKLSTAREIGDWLEQAQHEVDGLDEWQRANLKLIERQYLQQKCIPSDLAHAHTLATTDCERQWRESRKKQDFSTFLPALDKVFSLTRKIATEKSRHLNTSPYNLLLDIYEPDRTAASLEKIYSVLKAQLPPLIKKIIAKQKNEKILPLPEKIPAAVQKAIGLRIIEKMGFDLNRGRLDVAVHPFCIGSRDDARLTTRYDEANFLSGIFAIIHEAGHGLYVQNLPEQYRNQLVGDDVSVSVHESQSLIMECQVGTSLAFMQFLAKLLKEEFGFQGEAYSAENLYKMVTRVQPSFIRVEADEVTYPLHVILRFEIEQAIVQEELSAADIKKLWNEKMKEYLGIVPAHEGEGCFQDVHWTSGSLGSFPCYSTGAILASMLMQAAKKQHTSLEDQIREGDISALNSFLNQKVRNLGALKSTKDLIQYATGYEDIEPEVFIQYLTQKYLSQR